MTVRPPESAFGRLPPSLFAASPLREGGRTQCPAQVRARVPWALACCAAWAGEFSLSLWERVGVRAPWAGRSDGPGRHAGLRQQAGQFVFFASKIIAAATRQMRANGLFHHQVQGAEVLAWR